MKMQFASALAPGQVGTDRPGRAAPAGAESVADGKLDTLPVVGGLPGIDEGRHPPLFIQPMGVFGAAGGQITATDGSAAFAHAQALIRVTAYRTGAAGAKQIVLRNVQAGVGKGLSAFGTQAQGVALADGEILLPASVKAQEILV